MKKPNTHSFVLSMGKNELKRKKCHQMSLSHSHVHNYANTNL